MTKCAHVPGDLQQLFDAACDDRLSEADVAELESRLANDPALARRFLDYFHLQVDLRKLTRSQRVTASVLAEIGVHADGRDADRDEDCDTSETQLEPAASNRFRRLVAALSATTPLSLTVAAVVISVIIGVMAFIVVPFRSRGPANREVANVEFAAQLSRSVDARWMEPNRAMNVGSPLSAGQTLELSQGLAEISFRSGARVVLQGPAELTIASDMECQLTTGRITANVPETAHGFAVDTSATKVVDLGTEFGVAVEETQSAVQVHVFAGKVQLETPRSSGSPEIRELLAGESLRVLATGTSEKIASNEELFVRTLPASIADVPDPVHHWTFNDGSARDSLGEAHGELASGATVERGRLHLDGTPHGFMTTAPISRDILSKTLVAWVSLNTLDQAGGSALTLENADGDVFDGIVFGERTPRQWMAGSDGFQRSPIDNHGKAETLTAPSTVMMAMVQWSDGTVQIYRNGVIYASYRAATPPKYDANSAHALFGKRHTRGMNWQMDASIDEARIYAQPLSPRQIQQLFEQGPVSSLTEAAP